MEIKSSRELASYFNISESCVSRWVKKGLPVTMGSGLSYHYNLEKVVEWIKDRSPRHKRWYEDFLDQRELPWTTTEV